MAGGLPIHCGTCNINFSSHDLSIRDVLTGIALACGKALWIVKLSRDELSGQKAEMGKASPETGKAGHLSAVAGKFIPLIR